MGPEVKTGPLLTQKRPFLNQGKTVVYTPKLQDFFLTVKWFDGFFLKL
jgi:hypothetical protein